MIKFSFKYRLIVLCLTISPTVFSQFSVQELSYSNLRCKSSITIDVDNDGLPDIVANAKDINTINWFRNLGDSTFGGANLITRFAMGSNHLSKGDFNNDGFEDIVSANELDGSVMVYLNDGLSNFMAGNSITSSLPKSYAVEAADLDNDGDADIVAISNENNIVEWYENLGFGNFSQGTILSLSLNSPRELALEDLNNDGLIDVVVNAAWGNHVVWFENLGGTFTTSQLIVQLSSSTLGLHVGDTDNDGLKDIIIGALQNDEVFIIPNLGGGVFGSPQLLSTSTANIGKVSMIDINNDGFKDIIVSDWSTLMYFEYQSPGNFSGGYQVYFAGDYFSSFNIFDFNGDGTEDLVTTHEYAALINLFIKDTVSGFLPPFERGNEIHRVTSTASGDINGDGFKDIIAACDEDACLYSYLNDGTNQFPTKDTLIQKGADQENVIIYDLDGDGDQDVLALSNSSLPLDHIYLLENLGSGNFAPVDTVSIYGSLSDVKEFKLFDVDADGDKDIVVLGFAIRWFENLGGLNFASEQIFFIPPSDLFEINFADINNDGNEDIVGMSAVDDAIVWYEYLGPATFGPEQILVSPQSPSSFFVVDIDGDALVDIVAASMSEDKVYWYKNLGASSFGTQQLVSDNLMNPVIVQCDLNGDSLQDIMCFDNNYGDFRNLWFENLGGTFLNQAVIVSAEPYASLYDGHITDIDGDGDQDFIGAFASLYIVRNDLFGLTRAKGKLFVDLNSNGQLDSTDVSMTNISVESTPQADFSFSYGDGNYLIDFRDTSLTYQLFPEALSNWTIVTDSLFYTINVDSTFTIRDSLNFGFVPLNAVDSLQIDGVWGFPRCNDTILYNLTVNNVGTTLPYGYISLDLDTSITYVSSSPAPDSIIGDTYYWGYDSLMYFNSQHVQLIVIMPDFSFMSDTLSSLAEVVVLDGGGNISYFTNSSIEHGTSCAYDPNDKNSFPIGIDQPGYITDTVEWLDYTVRFQNTGTDTALVITIKDQLDSNLDWASLDLISYSHEVQTTLSSDGLITFLFDNINLPDSNVNFLGSQGFIKYRISLNDNLVAGTEIQNSAEIYFDFNPPVITNTKFNTIYDCSQILADVNNIESNICFGETVAVNRDTESTVLTWNLSSIGNGVGDFEWISDSAGVFSLDLNATNNFCSFDTTIAFEIMPLLDIIAYDSTNICDGDSILIFGEYRSTTGVYLDSLTTFYGCDSILSWQLEVSNYLVIDLSMYSPSMCLNNPSIQFSGTTPNGGIHSIGGVPQSSFDPLLYGVGFHTIVYEVTNASNCMTTDSIQIEVLDLPVVQIGFIQDSICEYDEEVYLSGTVPNGGVFSGAGLIDSLFNPTSAGPGLHLLHYSFTDGNMCQVSDSIEVTVVPNPNITFVSGSDTVCINQIPFALSYGTPTTGTYSGNGVINNLFDPVLAGVGLHYITYEISIDQCSDLDSMALFVDNCLSIEEQNYLISAKLIPNPTSSTFEIQTDLLVNDVVIYSMSGKEILRTKNLTIDISNFSSGQYIVELKTESGVYRLRLVKESF